MEIHPKFTWGRQKYPPFPSVLRLDTPSGADTAGTGNTVVYFIALSGTLTAYLTKLKYLV